MAVSVYAPEKKEDGLGKILAVADIAMKAKSMGKSGGSTQVATDVGSSAMSRRMKKMDDERYVTGSGGQSRPY